MDINKYNPPVFASLGGSWNDKAATVMGRLVTEEGNYFGSGEELYEVMGFQIAERWTELDEDPDPKYEWTEVMRELCIRFWENDKAQNPELGSGVRREGDVLIVDRYQKAGTDAPVMGLDEALTTVFDTDAHFVPVVGPTCRPSKNMPMHFSYLVFDLDTPGHGALSDNLSWLEGVIGKLEDHEGLSKYRAFYTTKGGCRIIYQPVRYLTGPEMQEMRLVYNSMFRGAGIEVDEACKDLSRLFRLPNVTRDGEYVEPMILDTTAHTVEVASFPKEVRNYRIEEDMESGKKFKVPIGGKALRSQIFEATGGWPRLVSGQLFYLQDEEVVYLDDSNAFLMWLEEEVDYLHIFEGSGFLTKTEIFTSIKMWNPESYDTIHKYPYEPLYDKTYLLNEIEPTVGTKKLDGLLDFFYPDSDVDRLVMKAAFCTPMFNSKDRPVFTVDSSSGRGAGKTSLVEVIGSLYGGLIEIPVNKVKVELKDEAKRAFFYEGGRSKRVVLVDNVQGFFGNSGFASIVTCKEISARRPYAKSTESRKNDVTWFITSNDANYDKDYISRTVFLFLKNHPPVDNFNKKVYEYLDKHKETILGEIINLIQTDSDITLPTFTRFVDWEQKVLKKVCKGDDDYSKIMKSLTDNKEHFDSDLEVCDSIVNQINGAIKSTTGGYFLPKKDLHKLYKEGGGEMGYYTFKSVVSEAIKTGGLGRLKAVEKNGGRHARNGKYCWLWESSDGSAPLLTAYTLGKFTPVS